jgi:hypothetical protein
MNGLIATTLHLCSTSFSSALRFSRLPIDPNMHLPQCLNAWMPFLNPDEMDEGGDVTGNLFSSLTLITAVTTSALVLLAVPS